MSDNDTSDQAALGWAESEHLDDYETWWFWEKFVLGAWREAVRRCEAQLKDCREAFDKAYADAHNWQSKYNELLAQIEERERKDFEAGWKAGWHYNANQMDEAYLAFKERNK